MSSPAASSSKQKRAPASAKPSLPVSALLSSHAANLLSNATVILCTREDLYSFLTAPPDPAHCPIAAASPLPESLQATMEDGEDEDDAMSDTSSSITSLQSMSHQILKPDGEPGRPGRGGYNLADQLAWDDVTFQKIKKFVHYSIKKHLDTTRSKSSQNRRSVKLVVQEALSAFPDLEDYDGCWPVQDLIKMRLKYTSRRARLSQRMEAGDVKGNKGRSV